MSAIHQVLLAGGAAAYQVPYSLRFRYSNNASLSRTGVVTPTNDKILTWSGWVKLGRSALTDLDYGILFSGYSASNDSGYAVIRIRNSTLYIGGWSTTWRESTALFRDPSAWYHIVVAVDTTNATAADRIKVYVNGNQITSFGVNNAPSLNATMGFNTASTTQRLGLDAPLSSGYHYDGYMAEVNFIDGQALTPSSFGQTDSATGVWVPKKYSGTYGTNGFYLKFADASAATATAIGKDSSGNANNFTPSGISVTSGVTYDQMTDTPTLNYAVLNAVDLSSGSLSAANMQWALNAGSARRGTFGMKSGKWYFECAITSGTNPEYFAPGIQLLSGAVTGYGGTSQVPSGYGYLGVNGNKLTGSTGSAYGSAFTTNDVISVAFDADAGKIWFAKNGTWQASGDPAAGTNAAFSSITSGDYFPYISNQTTANNNHAGYVNFGQRPFAYTPPSGFKALNTANLATPSIKKGSLYMDATLRTGTGATASVSSLGFQPDLVWIKSRSAATNHNLFDSSRGAQKGFNSNAGGPQYTDANSLTAFNANGYSLGSDASSRGVNINTNTYVDWAWKEGATPGFDVVTYTGNATNRTISHSLGDVPKMMIIKNLDYATGVPVVYHYKLNGGTNPANYYLYLSSTAAEAASSAFFNNTSPTASVFTVGTDTFVNANATNLVAYLWSEIEGFSKFGSYTGNASADGPFVWCGFRPRWIMIKDATAANLGWRIYDTVRETFNEMGGGLEASSAAAENYATSVRAIDILSNGFKIRVSASGLNGSGVVFVFAAFAENPFKYARAR